ncbi:ABC transporter permease [Brucella pituitosa]|nr:ABC transporter permease [Brucella pituitosa]PQZ50464.1 ABC transporter permease [Ochrobactrum sp. MYb19]PRA68503.1 ABC transporter permease [Ochrobactrum sp. MYb18]PRA74269.1 ABC transporter permease [Brucella thiophenivorans]PRA79044.1 ABC transporter permease [Ochrobactrum sp. MYb29]PRA90755.1 ABC transporter permease [Ochrobactrum sp. MYb14]PRA96206.1 ABC transporter permease [Ochrobactrum sp. MYb15]
MLAYILRRSAILILSVFIAAIVLFLLLRLLPGDPANALVSVGADAAQIEAARKQVGSDLPLYQQFTQFIGSLVRFDLGNSFVSGAPVLTEIGKRLIVTLPLTLMAFVLAIIIAVPLGILSVVRQKTWYGSIISVISQLGIAVPVFWIGILLVWVFAVKLRMFPSGGFPSRGWQSAPAAFQSLTLPVITIAIVMSASLIRYVRSATQDVLGSDYLRTARALGSTFSQALIRHGIRNGAVPVISILGIELASTLLGAVVVERVFSLPGLGSMLLLGIEQRDYPNVQGVLFVSTLLVLLVGFAADLVQRLIDPRLRSRSAGGGA